MDEEDGKNEEKERKQPELGEISEGCNPNTRIYSFAGEVQTFSQRLSSLMETEDISSL